jgi:hypothetical protein
MSKTLGDAKSKEKAITVGKEKAIAVTCQVKDFLPLEKITEFPDQLKTRDAADIKLIKKLLKKYGIRWPFFIWKKGKTCYCADGQGRTLGLLDLKAEGWEIPEIPIVYIYAKDMADAKQRMLRLNSRYGMITRESVKAFADGVDIDYDELAIPGPANMFFDAVVKDIDNYFNEVPDGDRKKESVKVCPHCGRILK